MNLQSSCMKGNSEIVAGLGLDTDSICAALLHDTLEDCADKVDLAKIKKEFGDQVAEIVDGLTKLVKIPFNDKEDEHMENLRKMFLAMSLRISALFLSSSLTDCITCARSTHNRKKNAD